MTPRDGAENQEISDTPMIGERIQKPLITYLLKALMIKNETEEYLPFKKVDQRRLSDVTKKVNAVIRYIEKDEVTLGLQKKLE